jgi:lipid-binding SYLF domain-containing protein
MAGCAARRYSPSGPPQILAAELETKGAVLTEGARAALLDRLDSALDIVADLERDLPPAVSGQARCIAIAPAVSGHGAPGVRPGFAACRHGTDWSPPVAITLVPTGPSGAASVEPGRDLALLVMTDAAAEELLADRLETGIGVDVYSREGARFVGASLPGQLVADDRSANLALYGNLSGLRSLLNAEP